MTASQTVAATIARERMIEVQGRVLAAFSGGADSTALVLLLSELGYDLSLGHVDHGLREESAAEAGRCARVAESLGIPFFSRRVSVSPPTQAEARRVRYLALEEMAAEAGASRIATGHTLDDEVETVRLRLDRGGFGLGIPPVRGAVVRPLLDLRRAETEEVCCAHGIEYLTDPSNFNPRYRRVAVRAGLASAPQGEIFRLARVGQAARALATGTDAAADELWRRIAFCTGPQVRLGRSALRDAPAPVGGALLRRAAGKLGLELTSGAVADALAKVVPVTGARLDLPGGHAVWSERAEVVLGRHEVDKVLPEMQIPVPGSARLPAWGLTFSAEPVPLPAGRRAAPADRLSEYVDASQLGESLVVRQWRPGDRFHPLGAPGSRKLQDFFVDAGVPCARRRQVPVVAAGDRIVWVAGHRLDDRFKLGPATTAVLRLTVEAA